MEPTRFVMLLILGQLSIACPAALAVSPPQTITLTRDLAKELYKNLNSIHPEGNAETKVALISAIEEYDGPGPFSYIATYSSKESPSKVHDIESSLAEALYKELLDHGNGLPYHSNTPTDTQTIVDAVVTCSVDAVHSTDYGCVATELNPS